MRRHVAGLLASSLIALGLTSVYAAASAGTYIPQPLQSAVAFDRPFKAMPARTGLAVLDRGNHRIVVLEEGRVEAQIGRIGQGKDDLHYPENFEVGSDGSFYIACLSIPFEVKVFDSSGRRRGGFSSGSSREEARAFRSLDLAVDPKGAIYLSQPYERDLVSVYNADGRRLRGFGEKVDPEAVWKGGCSGRALCRDSRYKAALNRVRLAAAPGIVLVAFDHAPIVRGYKPDGAKLFERLLEGEAVAEVVKRQWEDPASWQDLFSYNYDGIQLPSLINDVAVEATTGRFYILVGGREIHVLDKGGRTVTRYQPAPAFGNYRFDSLSTGQSGRVYLTTWTKIYETRIPLR